ncbi:MAG: SRPBCC domain-containing protein [Caldilinea sp. CFX5]|nr:SRPBCC domain-containing protein [Caldilinea sp. CFX5]
MSTSQPNRPLRLTLSKRYKAAPHELFAAWTDPESLRQWMCPVGGQVSFVAADVRVGGSYRIDMQFGDVVYTHTGVYREIRPPEKLVFTWVSKNTQQQETLVTVELFARGEQTELVLTHERLPNAESAQNHEQGWQSVLSRLEQVLAS